MRRSWTLCSWPEIFLVKKHASTPQPSYVIVKYKPACCVYWPLMGLQRPLQAAPCERHSFLFLQVRRKTVNLLDFRQIFVDSFIQKLIGAFVYSAVFQLVINQIMQAVKFGFAAF